MLLLNKIRLYFIFFPSLVAAILYAKPVLGQTNPEFQSTPLENISYGSTYQYDIIVFDAEGADLEVKIQFGTLPSGVSFNNVGGNYSIEGTPNETGDFPIVLEVYETPTPANQSTQSFTISIAKTALTVTANDKNIIYGDDIPALDLSYSGFVTGESPADLTTVPIATTAATNSSDVGDYPIVVSGGTSDNYTFTYTPGNLNIAKADQTITFNAISDRTYGDPAFELSASASSGLPISYAITEGPATLVGNLLSITGTGQVTVEASQAGSLNFNPAVAQSQSFQVEKAVLTVTANDKNIIYGDDIPALDLSYSGFVTGESPADLTTIPIATTAATNSSEVGDYPIVVSGGTSDNYTFTYTPGNLNIAKADQTITFNAISDRTYGDPAFELSASAGSGLPISYAITEGPATLVGNLLSITGTGQVTVEASQAGSLNFNPAVAQSQSFQVEKAVLTVTANDKNIIYGDDIPALDLSYSGFVTGESPADLTTVPIATTAATNSSDVGDYPIVVSGGTSDNYTFTYTPGNLNIAKADQTITFNAISDRTYGDPAFELSASAGSGLPISYAITEGPATLVGNLLSITGTGQVTVEASQAGSLNFNPAVAQSQSFQVEKAVLTVTANDKNIIYGDDIPALDLSYSGFVTGESPADLTTVPIATTAATNSSDVGDYPIVVSGGTSDNYTFTYTPGNLNIAKADQTITFNAISDRTYGDPAFELSASASSGLPISYAITEGPATLVGNLLSITGTGQVTVEASQAGSLNFNPAVAQSQSFQVEKAVLTVTANDKNIIYGDDIPALDLSYSGFVTGESPADLTTIPIATTAATNSSEVGDYPIVVSGGTSDNYTFTYTPGNLNIAKADQTITFNAISDRTYGDPAFELSASAGSGLPISYAITEGPATLVGNLLSITGTGQVTVEASQAGSLNFNPAVAQSQSFQVEKAIATIQIMNTLQNFDGTPKEVSVTTQPDGLPYTLTYNGSTAPPTSAGNYIVEVTITDNNFRGQLTSTLVINNAPTSTGIPDQQVVEDGSGLQINLLSFFDDVEDDYSSLILEIVSISNSTLFTTTTLEAGLFEITLELNANGLSEVTVRCTDTNGLSTEDTFEIEVTAVQDPPFFISSPLTEVLQNEDYEYAITADDYDLNDDLSISSIVSLPTWLSLTDNGDGTGVLTGSTNNSTVGVYGIALRVADQNGNSANQFFDIEVIDVNDPPVFTSTPITSAQLNNAYTYSVSTQDIDPDDEVSLYAVDIPSWLTFSTESLPKGNAILEGTPSDADRNSEQSVTLLAVDTREDSSFQTFEIIINFPNTAPFFTSEPIIEATQDQIYNYQITADDVEGDALTIRAVNLPPWLSLDEATWLLQGIPRNEDVAGENNATLEVTDFLGLTATQTFVIEVENVNDPPAIVSLPDTTAVQNQLYTYTIETEDIDVNDEVQINIITKPSWLNFDGETIISGTPTLSEVENSPFPVEIQINDLAGAIATQSFQINVQLENTPPTIDPIEDPTPINEDSGEEYLINLTGITDGDENSQELNLEVSTDFQNLFEELYITYSSPENTAQLIYKVLPDSFGIATITIRVEDDGPASVNFIETNFQVEVLPVNDTPIFRSNPITRTVPNTTYRYFIRATDADPDDELTISSSDKPDWLAFTDNGDGTAKLEGIVPEGLNSQQVILTVRDVENASSTQSYELKINHPPLASDFSVRTNEDEPFQFEKSVFTENYSDDENDPINEVKLYFSQGKIELDGSEISSGQAISFIQNINLQFFPPSNFFGNINLQWSASDGFVHSKMAEILMVVDTVNDRPILSNIENSTIDFIQGSEPLVITESITVSDIDDLIIDTAWVQISQNYNPDEDRLSLEELNIDNIASEFDQNSGLLTITGEASKSDYELILRSVSYQNINTLSSDTKTKLISFLISDGKNHSDSLSRFIQLVDILPELDFVNAFTPDGNGVNDTWDFKNLEVFEQVNITVYNAQGLRVYQCSSNDCKWDGTFNQRDLPAGTYFYLIKLNNGRRKYEGNVTILR